MGGRHPGESPIRLLLQVGLGAVWVYDGLVTKLLAPMPHVPGFLASWTPPGGHALVLRGIGVLELVLGLLLLQGWILQGAVLAHCLLLGALSAALIVLRPESLLDATGAIPQNIPLIAGGIGLLLMTGRRAAPESAVPLLLRIGLGGMWACEGFLLAWWSRSAGATEMLEHTGLIGAPHVPAFLRCLGGVEMALALTLLIGLWVRGMAVLQVLLLTAVSAVVGWTSPAYLQGGLGGLAKNLGLIGCALVLYWTGAGGFSCDAWVAGNAACRRWSLRGVLWWNLIRTLGMEEMYRLQHDAAHDTRVEETLQALRLENRRLEADMRTLARRHGGRPPAGPGLARAGFWLLGAMTVVLGVRASLILDLWLKRRGLHWYTRAVDLLPPDEGITYRVLQSMQERETSQVRALREALRAGRGSHRRRR